MDLRTSRDDLNLYYKPLGWTDWTPTISDEGTGTETVTINNAQYFELGKYVYFTVNLTITNAGGATGGLICSLPLPMDEGSGINVTLGSGREGATTGKMLIVHKTSTQNARVVTYDSVNNGVWVTGYQLVFSGVYRRT